MRSRFALVAALVVVSSACITPVVHPARQILDEASANLVAFEGARGRQEYLSVDGNVDGVVVESKEKKRTTGLMVYGFMAAETDTKQVRFPVVILVGGRGPGYVACEFSSGKSSFAEAGALTPGQRVTVRGMFRAVEETEKGVRLSLNHCSLESLGAAPASYEPLLAEPVADEGA